MKHQKDPKEPQQEPRHQAKEGHKKEFSKHHFYFVKNQLVSCYGWVSVNNTLPISRHTTFNTHNRSTFSKQRTGQHLKLPDGSLAHARHGNGNESNTYAQQLVTDDSGNKKGSSENRCLRCIAPTLPLPQPQHEYQLYLAHPTHPDLPFPSPREKTASTQPQTVRPSPTSRIDNRPSVVRLPFPLAIVVWLHFLLGSFWGPFGVLNDRSSKLSSDYISFSHPFGILFESCFITFPFGVLLGSFLGGDWRDLCDQTLTWPVFN